MGKHPRIMGQPVYDLKCRNGPWPYIYLNGRRVNIGGWPGPETQMAMISDGVEVVSIIFGEVVPGPTSSDILSAPSFLNESL